MDIPFVGQTYADRSLDANAQRCVNFYPALSPTPDNPQRQVLYPTPWYSLYQDLTVTLASAPGLQGTEVRALFAINEVLYCVFGNALAVVSPGPDAGHKGTLNTSSGKVSVACNTVELVLADGRFAYVFNLTTGVFSPVTGGSFPAAGGVTNVTFQDGYVLAAVNDSKTVIQSDLLAGGAFGPQAFAVVTSFPDDIVAVFSDELQLYVFGPKVAEVRFNSAAVPFAFEKQQGVLVQAGLVAWPTLAKAGNSVIWLAADKDNKAYVAALQGYTPQSLSTPPMNEAFERYATVADAFAYTYREGDTPFYVLTFPAERATWACDLKTRQWHERSYAGGADLPTCCVLWGGRHVVGTADGRLYLMSQEYSGTDYRVPFLPPPVPQVRTRTSPHLRADGKFIHVHELELLAEAGTGVLPPDFNYPGLDTPTARDPLVTLEVSRDGGHTWTGVGTRPLGRAGQYRTRLVWRRLGRARCWTFRVTVTDPVRTCLLGARADVTVAAK